MTEKADLLVFQNCQSPMLKDGSDAVFRGVKDGSKAVFRRVSAVGY